jgi:putative spermidine/putrescine transport system ATP-binding protein
LSLRSVSKVYGTFVAVDQIHMEVQQGEFVTLLGPSGSGKTTTLKMIAGFEAPSSGAIFAGDEPLTAPPHKRDIGMVFQNYALFPHMTTFQNVEYPLKIRKVAKQERRRRVTEALNMVGLSDRGNHNPKQLSGGQQQRVALARALVFHPRMVLLDEPLGALDRKLREHLQLEIKRIQHELGITMLYVTHDQEEALVMSDRIAVFNEGKIEQMGSAEEIYERPVSLFVSNFIGESNVFQGRLETQEGEPCLKSDNLRLKVPTDLREQSVGDTCALMVRPEKLRVSALEEQAGPHENAVEATVSEIVYLGSERKYLLKATTGNTLISREQAGRKGIELPQVGGRVSAQWNSEDGVLTPLGDP